MPGGGATPGTPPRDHMNLYTPRKAAEYFFLDRRITNSSDKFNFQPGKLIIMTRKFIIWQSPLFLFSPAHRVDLPLAMKGLRDNAFLVTKDQPAIPANCT